MLRPNFILTSLLVLLTLSSWAQIDATPTMTNVKYGPAPLQVFDFFKTTAPGKNPVVIYFHGGGYQSGDKLLTGRQLVNMDLLRQQGISFISANYRLAINTRVDTVLQECERLIRYIKANQEMFAVDTARIGVYGTSAGGGITQWLLHNPQRGNPNATDPVMRQDTRIRAGAHIVSQSTLDFAQWADIVGLSENWWDTYAFKDDFVLYKITDRAQYDDPAIKELRAKLDLPKYIDATDPPMFYANDNVFLTPQTDQDVIHHPQHTKFLESVSKAKNHRHVAIFTNDGNALYDALIDFFCQELSCRNVSVPVNEIKTPAVQVFPTINPRSVRLDPLLVYEPISWTVYNTFGQTMAQVHSAPGRFQQDFNDFLSSQRLYHPAGPRWMMISARGTRQTLKFIIQ